MSEQNRNQPEQARPVRDTGATGAGEQHGVIGPDERFTAASMENMVNPKPNDTPQTPEERAMNTKILRSNPVDSMPAASLNEALTIGKELSAAQNRMANETLEKSKQARDATKQDRPAGMAQKPKQNDTVPPPPPRSGRGGR